MKAIRIQRYGGPEVLERVELPVAELGPGEVLVEVAYAGINFMDVHTRQGKYERSRSYPLQLPLTLGMEGAGVVRDVGHDVGLFKEGDHVAWCISWGSYADFAIVPAGRLARIPSGVGLDQAAAIIFQGSTADYLINDVANVSSAKSCLIHGASGGIGQLLVQMAKRRGATVFATTSTAEKVEIVRSLHADEVMLYEDGGFADRVREATQGRGVDVVFDAVGGPTLRASFRTARTKGLIVNNGSVGGSIKDLDPIELGEAGSLYLTRPRLIDYLGDAASVQQRADRVFAALQDGTIAIRLERQYSFDDVEDAHAALEERRIVGKSVLKL